MLPYEMDYSIQKIALDLLNAKFNSRYLVASLNEQRIFSLLEDFAKKLGEVARENVTVLELDADISNEELDCLSNLFSNIQRLKIKNESLTRLIIPENWKNKLVYLDVVGCETFSEFIGLDGSLSLKCLRVSFTALERVPTGCENLEEFEAEGTEKLSDATGLNHLKHLKSVRLGYGPSLDVPTGLDRGQLLQFYTERQDDPSNVEELTHLPKHPSLNRWRDPEFKWPTKLSFPNSFFDSIRI